MVFFKKGETEKEPEKHKQENVPELDEMRKRVKEGGLPEFVEETLLKEIEKLFKTSQSAAEYTIGINYVEYVLSLPWNKVSEDNLDILHAEKLLNIEHYGLSEIKDRILEHLAVRILKLSRQFKILVVDDEKMTRQNLHHVLTKEGYAVTLAENGQQAVVHISKEKVDVIITDLKMDRINGLGVLETARAIDPSIQVIIITGYATVQSAVESIKKGSFHYISKPFKLNEIRETVERALKKKKYQLQSKGPILCLAGPPGTGKTSLGRSIAKSLEKKFIRISLAGVKDEAEIRGHRRSYVGALPGRIIQEIRRVGTKNPVFMLDEVDKLGQEFKGDPAAALLEVLDPEQNSQFIDHYIDIPFDLSQVMFITTANRTDLIPGPLRDRMEIINLSGYTEEEKEIIAKKHLIPESINEAGLNPDLIRFQDDAIATIVREYTNEAGLRNLKRQIDAICRKEARNSLSQETIDFRAITVEDVRNYLGPPKYRHETAGTHDRIGIATALAWTETGGELIFIEATMMNGQSNLILTGSLGDVMKESAQAALSYIRSNTKRFGISENFFKSIDIHIHVPAGAIPKDGPSAGLTIAVALFSLLTNRPARRNVALSGELTLSGRLLAIGGIREKVLAARRAGITTVIFPANNEQDILSIPERVKKGITILTADHIDDVIDKVLK